MDSSLIKTSKTIVLCLLIVAINRVDAANNEIMGLYLHLHDYQEAEKGYLLDLCEGMKILERPTCYHKINVPLSLVSQMMADGIVYNQGDKIIVKQDDLVEFDYKHSATYALRRELQNYQSSIPLIAKRKREEPSQVTATNLRLVLLDQASKVGTQLTENVMMYRQKQSRFLVKQLKTELMNDYQKILTYYLNSNDEQKERISDQVMQVISPSLNLYSSLFEGPSAADLVDLRFNVLQSTVIEIMMPLLTSIQEIEGSNVTATVVELADALSLGSIASCIKQNGLTHHDCWKLSFLYDLDSSFDKDQRMNYVEQFLSLLVDHLNTIKVHVDIENHQSDKANTIERFGSFGLLNSSLKQLCSSRDERSFARLIQTIEIVTGQIGKELDETWLEGKRRAKLNITGAKVLRQFGNKRPILCQDYRRVSQQIKEQEDLLQKVAFELEGFVGQSLALIQDEDLEKMANVNQKLRLIEEKLNWYYDLDPTQDDRIETIVWDLGKASKLIGPLTEEQTIHIEYLQVDNMAWIPRFAFSMDEVLPSIAAFTSTWSSLLPRGQEKIGPHPVLSLALKRSPLAACSDKARVKMVVRIGNERKNTFTLTYGEREQ